MKALTFTIELLEPLLATGLEGDPNAGVSLKYVPGSVLRGAVIGLYLRDGKTVDPSDETARNLFFNGRTCFLNAYPQSQGKRSLPVPLSWQKEKDTDKNKKFYDFSFKDRDDNQYKDLGSPFFVFKNSATIIKVDPETRLAVHTQRDAKKGRSTSEEGAVFRYESVVAGTRFCGAIIGNETLLDEIRLLIDKKEVLLGGSRTAGYGKTRIFCAPNTDDWYEWKQAEAIKKDAEFTITLLSNALIRDESGQFQTEIDPLFKYCGEIIPDKTFKRPELVGGFNRKWGLPLPQQLSVKAGSVFKFKASRDIDENTIQGWLDEGVGERRVEGFGRIAVDLNKGSELSFTDADETKLPEIDLKSRSGTAHRLGKKLVERISRQNFEKAITSVVGEVEIQGKVSNSQIARLRLVVRDVLRGEEAIQVKTFFEDLKKSARDQFDGVRIKETGIPKWTKLSRWIADTIETKDKLDNIAAPKIGGLEISTEEWEDLKLEYHLRLIDGVLAKAAKENRQ